jgi:hypothetical protein
LLGPGVTWSGTADWLRTTPNVTATAIKTRETTARVRRICFLAVKARENNGELSVVFKRRSFSKASEPGDIEIGDGVVWATVGLGGPKDVANHQITTEAVTITKRTTRLQATFRAILRLEKLSTEPKPCSSALGGDAKAGRDENMKKAWFFLGPGHHGAHVVNYSQLCRGECQSLENL